MDSKPDRRQTAVQFATTALALALVGIYEVMSCSVSQ
jgi:hypothetical protein